MAMIGCNTQLNLSKKIIVSHVRNLNYDSGTQENFTLQKYYVEHCGNTIRSLEILS